MDTESATNYIPVPEDGPSGEVPLDDAPARDLSADGGHNPIRGVVGENPVQSNRRKKRLWQAAAAMLAGTSGVAGVGVVNHYMDRWEEAEAAEEAVLEGAEEVQELNENFNISDYLDASTTLHVGRSATSTTLAEIAVTSTPATESAVTDNEEEATNATIGTTTIVPPSSTAVEAPTTEQPEVNAQPEIALPVLSSEMLNRSGAIGMLSIPSLGIKDMHTSIGNVANDAVEELARGPAVFPSSHQYEYINENGEVVDLEIVNDLSLPFINHKGLTVVGAHATSPTSEAGAAPFGSLEELQLGEEISMGGLLVDPASGQEYIGIARYKVTAPCHGDDPETSGCHVKADEFFSPFVKNMAEELKDQPGKLLAFTCDKGVSYRRYVVADLESIDIIVMSKNGQTKTIRAYDKGIVLEPGMFATAA